MKQDFEKRLAKLERQIKASGDSAVWIDARNNVVRVDINGRRGQETTFPTVYDARIWLEGIIDAHAGGIINYIVDNIADLHEDAEELRGVLRDIIPGQIVVPDAPPRLAAGFSSHPKTFDAENNFGAVLAMRKMEPGTPADLRLWCLANLLWQYCSGAQFKERWQSGELSEDDNRMLMALLVVYAWTRSEDPGETCGGFMRLFYQVTGLPPPPPPPAGVEPF